MGKQRKENQDDLAQQEKKKGSKKEKKKGSKKEKKKGSKKAAEEISVEGHLDGIVEVVRKTIFLLD